MFINFIVWVDHEVISGITRTRAISISKIINKIINRKNRRENGFRDVEFKLIPHSKVINFSDHFLASFLKNSGSKSILIIMKVMISLYMVSCIIY